ncbi:alpha-galactosidase [candidate division KSB1 bacterium]|nr:alpha-galactosidase [candidate division KSB1 bacterium]
MKITMIGAGSGFTRPLATDIMFIPEIDTGTIALVDIDARRLDLAYRLVQKVVALSGKKWQIQASTDRREVMADSDYVISFIEVSGLPTVRLDNDIPLKYGISQCIGDTVGPGGIFKALRTVPAWLEILKDIERYCPNALVMNYTNPMSIMTLAAIRTTTLPVIGLCHSVQGSSRQLAEYAEVPYPEMQWKCAGINHMAWFTELRHRGVDLYPRLKEKYLTDPEFVKKEPVRFNTMLNFGYFVTESSGHFSEYVPYYRKREALIDQYCGARYLGERSFYANEWPKWRQDQDARIQREMEGQEALELKRGHEYASLIIEAKEKNQPAVVYGSVLNRGLIENLPATGVVEVACMIDQNGINPCQFGSLPPQLAALCQANMALFECVVQALTARKKDYIYYAMMLDPLTAAVCSLDEIHQMTDEMLAAEREYLPAFCFD